MRRVDTGVKFGVPSTRKCGVFGAVGWPEPGVLTTRLASWDRAVAADGMPGGAAAAGPARPMTSARTMRT
jgi:hypothetical protein